MSLGLSISVLTLTQEYSTHNYIQFELYQWLDLWQQTVNKTVKYKWLIRATEWVMVIQLFN